MRQALPRGGRRNRGSDVAYAPVSKLSLGMIGVGNWGKNVLRNMASLPAVDLRAICDPSAANLSKAAAQYPGVPTYADPDKVLADPSIAAVAIATPAATHHAIAKKSLAAGKHVFVEKPMAMSAAEAADLVEAASKTKSVLMVGHLLEYHPAVDKLKSLVDGGELGSIRYLYSQRVNLGVVRKDENAWWSLAPHDISVALYLLGKEPRSVAARGASFLNKGIEDVVFANLSFEGGLTAQIHVSWLDPHKIRKFTIVGAKKMVTFDDSESTEKVRIYDKGADVALSYETYGESITLRSGDIVIPRIDSVEPLKIECGHFVECALTGRRPRSDADDGARVVRVLEAGQRSLEQGGIPVDVAS